MIQPSVLNRLNLFVEEQTGITIPESNYGQLENYLKDKDIDDFLRTVMKDQHEYGRLMEAVTINETYFFREEKQFRYLRDSVLPDLAREGREIVLWSSTCSSGEEALSLYALCRSVFRSDRGFSIFASDISRGSLDKFRSAVYRQASFRGDGEQFSPLIDDISSKLPDGRSRIMPEHLERIRIFENNLFEPPAEDLPEMDIIMLRNTLIYMNPQNKRTIIDNIIKKLRTGGLLFLSSSELPLISHPALSIREAGDVYCFVKGDPHDLSPEILTKRVHSAVETKRESRIRKKDTRSVAEKDLSAENRVCEIVSLRLNNRISKKAAPPIEEAADLIISYLETAAEGDTGNTKMKLNALSGSPAAEFFPALLKFFTAEIESREGNRETARQSYREALAYNPGLWPAKFFLARSLQPENPEIKKLAAELINEINEYIESHRWDYQFLLEGFNARYFVLICEKMYSDAEDLSYGRR